MVAGSPKIWGKNTEIYHNESISVNFLNLVKGGTCSLHIHKFKGNIFYVIKGELKIHTETGTHTLLPGQSMFIPPLMKHQFEATEESFVIEVMMVRYEHSDIIRETFGFIQDYAKENSDNTGKEE